MDATAVMLEGGSSRGSDADGDRSSSGGDRQFQTSFYSSTRDTCSRSHSFTHLLIFQFVNSLQ